MSKASRRRWMLLTVIVTFTLLATTPVFASPSGDPGAAQNPSVFKFSFAPDAVALQHGHRDGYRDHDRDRHHCDRIRHRCHERCEHRRSHGHHHWNGCVRECMHNHGCGHHHRD